MSVNSQLSEKNLTCKLTVLVALSSALRASSTQHLNNNFMAKTKSSYNFYFNKLHKSWRKGKAPPVVTYQEYTQDKSLCVVRIYCPNREVEIWKRTISTFVKFYSPSQTSSFFHNICMAKNYPHKIRY